MMTESAWRAVATNDLTDDQRAVLNVIENATGMFKRLGYSADLIAAILARNVNTFVDPVRVRADLQQLQTRGLAVPTANDAERWVLA